MIAAATALRLPENHFIDILVHGLFQVGYGLFKLTGRQTTVAGGTGGVGLFEPADRLIDGGTAIWAVQG